MDHVAFVLFVAIFCGGLATVTIGMFWIAIALFGGIGGRAPRLQHLA